MIKEIALRKLASVTKEADYMSDGVGNAITNMQLDALEQGNRDRITKIISGKYNPALAGYTDKKKLLKSLKKKPSLLNKLKWVLA